MTYGVSRFNMIPVMAVIFEKVLVCICERCGHKWQPKQRNPQMCPDCKSLLWRIKPDSESEETA